jgi:hypothetical protein
VLDGVYAASRGGAPPSTRSRCRMTPTSQTSFAGSPADWLACSSAGDSGERRIPTSPIRSVAISRCSPRSMPPPSRAGSRPVRERGLRSSALETASTSRTCPVYRGRAARPSPASASTRTSPSPPATANGSSAGGITWLGWSALFRNRAVSRFFRNGRSGWLRQHHLRVGYADARTHHHAASRSRSTDTRGEPAQQAKRLTA